MFLLWTSNNRAAKVVTPIDTSGWIDLSYPVHFLESDVRAFDSPTPKIAPYKTDEFVGSVDQGGSCKCDVVTYIPHCHGTHTECVGHLMGKNGPKVTDLFPSPISGKAYLATVSTNPSGAIVECSFPTNQQVTSLIVRTEKSSETSFFAPECMTTLVQKGIKHLLFTGPSVDPVDDGGKLLAHRSFWETSEIDGLLKYPNSALNRTITELVNISTDVPDGIYQLFLTLSNMALDAVSSRPYIYKP